VVDARLRFDANRVVDRQIVYDNVFLDLAVADGALAVAPLQLGMTGGNVAVSGRIDTNPERPSWDLEATAQGVAPEALLQAFGRERVLSEGRADVFLDLHGEGSSIAEVLASLNGQASISVGGGRVVHDFVRRLSVDPTGEPEAGGEGAELRCLATRFAIENGVAKVRGTVMNAAGATLFGNGTIGLSSETLDISIGSASREPTWTTFAVPIRVEGAFADPTVAPLTDMTTSNGVMEASGRNSAAAFDNNGSAIEGGGDRNACVAALDAEPEQPRKPRKRKKKVVQEATIIPDGDERDDLSVGDREENTESIEEVDEGDRSLFDQVRDGIQSLFGGAVSARTTTENPATQGSKSSR
jgi:uncharacterized protein involved in outer membrane biogenesis